MRNSPRRMALILALLGQIAGPFAAVAQSVPDSEKAQAHPQRDGFWTARLGDRVEGSVALDGTKADTDGAHLRWFILSDALRGQGAGHRLMEEALAFCRRQHYRHVYLWTFKGLDAARHLYEKHGFRLEVEAEASQWGTTVVEQRFGLDL